MQKTRKINEDRYPYGRRLIAFFIDWYLSSLLAVLPIYLVQSISRKEFVMVNSLEGLPIQLVALGATLAVVVYFIYFGILPAIGKPFGDGKTLGRKLLGIRLTTTNGDHVPLQAFFLREIIGILLLHGNLTSVNTYLISLAYNITDSASFLPLQQTFYYAMIIISFLLLVSKKKQTLYDLISNTKIVMDNNSGPNQSL